MKRNASSFAGAEPLLLRMCRANTLRRLHTHYNLQRHQRRFVYININKFGVPFVFMAHRRGVPDNTYHSNGYQFHLDWSSTKHHAETCHALKMAWNSFIRICCVARANKIHSELLLYRSVWSILSQMKWKQRRSDGIRAALSFAVLSYLLAITSGPKWGPKVVREEK